MIGTKLAHYEITSDLGAGGMGEVYQATDLKLGRSVAITLLPDAFTHDAERVARFEREARDKRWLEPTTPSAPQRMLGDIS
jgi:serine/threonine protein kinase